MTSTEVAPARATTQWAGAGVVAVLLLAGGFLPAWNGVSISTPAVRGPDKTLVADGAWPYLLALTLALTGLAAAAAFHGRGPEWLAPAALTVTTVPAFALTTELADPPEYYAPYSGSLDGIGFADIAGGGHAGMTIDVGPGAWITFTTLMCLAIGAVIWLGRSLNVLANPRYAAGALVLIIVVAFVGYAIADSVSEEASCVTSPVDTSGVSPDWAFYLVLYLPAAWAGIGIGALTRRRLASGLLLLAGALAAIGAMALIGFVLVTPCLD
ncbi:MAG TPA: hypothetical protein VMZ00_00240 [Sporichthya sp.]|nr:hypothetical protein [Sporichthya sp.]